MSESFVFSVKFIAEYVILFHFSCNQGKDVVLHHSYTFCHFFNDQDEAVMQFNFFYNQEDTR